MEVLEFNKMDKEMDEVLDEYHKLGGDKFDKNFRNTRKDLRTLCGDFKETYVEMNKYQAERDIKVRIQKHTMEFNSLDFRIKTGIWRLGKDLVDIRKEIKMYCKENEIHHDQYYKKLEKDAEREARGGHYSEESDAFESDGGGDGFDSEEGDFGYDDLMNSLGSSGNITMSGVSHSNSQILHGQGRANNGTEAARRPERVRSEVNIAVNKEDLNEQEKQIYDIAECVDNYDKCLLILIRKEVYFRIGQSESIDEWAATLPEIYRSAAKNYHSQFSQEIIHEVDEEEHDVDEIRETRHPTRQTGGLQSKKRSGRREAMPMTRDEQVALEMFDELDQKMDDNLKLISNELDMMAEKLSVNEAAMDENGQMIDQIDRGTKALLQDVRDQNNQMKQTLENFRQPNKLVCDIILIVVLCLLIALSVFLLKRYFEIKAIIEKVKASHTTTQSRDINHRVLLVI